MAKFAVLFLAALAFQASVAVPMYFEGTHLFNYLDEIRTEVRDLTMFFEKDFPEHHLAVKTVTWQCNRLVEVLEVVIHKLRDETMMVRGEHKVFKDVIYTLEELVDVLRKVTVYHDLTSIHELKKYFVITINTVFERFEKLVTLTQTYYPEFRYTLKYLLVDFMTALHGIRSHFVHISTGFEVVHGPRHLIKDIHEYTREFTDILKDFHHPAQIKVALRGYLHYVDEIVRKLQNKDILGHKELDVVISHLTDKLRKIVLPLKEIMYENMVDMKVFRTEIVTKCLEIVSVFEQLVQLCEDKVLPEELTHFLVKIIYHYWYAVRHVCYEIKFGYKIGFFNREFYTPEFYTRYGYGLYEKDFHRRFVMPYFHDTDMLHYYRMDHDIFTPYRYESLFPMHDKFMYGFGKYYNTMKYDYKFGMHMDIVRNIEMLVKRVYERFHYNTMDVKEVHPMIIYYIREFIDILDLFLEKYETKMQYGHLYSDKYFEDFFYKVKEMKMELKQIVNTGIFTNVHEIRMRLFHCIEFVAMDLCKFVERDIFFKDICYKFVNFLQKICGEHFTFDHEFVPMTGRFYHHTDKYFPTFYNRWTKY